MLIKLYALFFCFLVCFALRGQDLHFSQWDFAQQQVQPSWVGGFEGDYRAMAIARQQWFSVPVPYSSFGLGFDKALWVERLKSDRAALGVQFLYDRAGDARLSTSQLLATWSYAKRLHQAWYLCFGVQGGFGQRRLQTSALRFDDQYDGDRFNPNLVSGDMARFERTALYYADWGMGMGLRYERSERTWARMGMGFLHLNAPRQSFLGTDNRLLPALSLGLLGGGRINRVWDILYALHYRSQGVYTQTLLGGGAKYHLDFSPGRETALSMQVLLRQTPTNLDALVWVVGLDYQTWRFGFSFDATLSRFAQANRGYGAFELGVAQVWRSVRGPSSPKVCPVL